MRRLSTVHRACDPLEVFPLLSAVGQGGDTLNTANALRVARVLRVLRTAPRPIIVAIARISTMALDCIPTFGSTVSSGHQQHAPAPAPELAPKLKPPATTAAAPPPLPPSRPPPAPHQFSSHHQHEHQPHLILL